VCRTIQEKLHLRKESIVWKIDWRQPEDKDANEQTERVLETYGDKSYKITRLKFKSKALNMEMCSSRNLSILNRN
jgi:hypothetical protein